MIKLLAVPGQAAKDRRTFPPGRYELLVTDEVARAVAALGDSARLRPLTDEEAVNLLTRHLRNVLSAVLGQLPVEGRTERQVELCNTLICDLEAALAQSGKLDADMIARAEILLAILADRPAGFAQVPVPAAPLTPLSEDAFFANSPNDPRLAAELHREMSSADSIDLLCAFITWNGVRIFKQELQRAVQRGARFRVITTTYTGITEPRALEELVQFGAQVRVSYDTRATRLHAKS